jgi:hypothetical protein
MPLSEEPDHQVMAIGTIKAKPIGVGDLTDTKAAVRACLFSETPLCAVVLGIGTHQKLDWLQIQWPLPSGNIERFTDLPIDRYITIVEGEGICRQTPEHPCSLAPERIHRSTRQSADRTASRNGNAGRLGDAAQMDVRRR